MDLAYLDFDFSGEADGSGTFEAMAAASPAHWPPLQAEVLHVLDWAQRRFGPPVALDENGEWDCALHAVREVATPLQVRYRPGAAALELQAEEPDPPRLTLTVTLAGSEAFCDALRAAFAIA